MFTRKLYYVDVWNGVTERLEISKEGSLCPTCDLGQFDFLQARAGSRLTSLCGHDAVQISLEHETEVSFLQLAERLRSVGQVSFNAYLLRFSVDSYEFFMFPNGRTIIKGCTDPTAARTLFARYIGM